MKAIILTAGLGRRMRPLSNDVHKTLLPIAGTSILEGIVDSLLRQNVDDICIVTGYRAQEIRDFVSSRLPDLAVHYVHNADYETTNNVFSMALALESIDIDSDVLLIESDLIFEPAVLAQLIETPHKNAALVDRYHSGLDGTVVSITEDDVIAEVFPGYMQDSNFDFDDKYKTLNIYKFSQEFCQTSFRQLLSFYSRSIDDNCYYELLLGVLIYMRAATVHAVLVEHPWAEVDDPNDLDSAEFAFNPGARYQIATRAWGGYWNYPLLDFAFIRNMYFPTPAMIAELRNGLGDLIHNYGSAQSVLNRKLSYLELVDEKHLMLLNGASQAFPWLGDRFQDLRIAIPSPTFGEYDRAFPRAERYADTGTVSLSEVTDLAARSDVIVFVNPNNPTGTSIPTGDIVAVAIDHPDVTIIVDESFIDFSDTPSIVQEVERRQLGNVIVLKSLSKCLGVPGLRLGWLYSCSEQLIADFGKWIPAWNVNSIAENFLEIILKHRDEMTRSFETTKADREAFRVVLEGVDGVSAVLASGANFVTLRLGVDAAATLRLAERATSEHSVLVKDVSGRFPDCSGYLRLAVRLPKENEALAALLGRLVQKERIA